MNNLHAKRHGDYVVVDFDDVTEKGLKSLTDELKKSGAPVSSVEATNRKSKKDGLFVKKAKLNFENGQNVTLFIGDQGDIYQMSLNGRKQPVPGAKNEKELAKKLADMLEKNQASFDKSFLKKQKKPKATGERPLIKNLANRSKESADKVATLRENKQQLDAELAKRNDKQVASTKNIEDLTSTLNSELQESRELEEQLRQAQIAAGVEIQ
ncbi:hypothetical protein [Vibrio parahaemolyticus]|uniref:defense against restriction DarA-related protein n=1 Tax=Vibrio parahaemolyticus TaxID=670 RepID=UPI000C9C2903|nr:hypothetical protein [Vibrio parahaemolyticus]PMS91955.1 hypothetical protein C1T06_22965 [Vibrio parahaemolyticus]